jgi:hypothetical protein
MAKCGEVRCDVRSVMRGAKMRWEVKCEVRCGVRCGAAPVGMQRPSVGGGVMRCAGVTTIMYMLGSEVWQRDWELQLRGLRKFYLMILSFHFAIEVQNELYHWMNQLYG